MSIVKIEFVGPTDRDDRIFEIDHPDKKNIQEVVVFEAPEAKVTASHLSGVDKAKAIFQQKPKGKPPKENIVVVEPGQVRRAYVSSREKDGFVVITHSE